MMPVFPQQCHNSIISHLNAGFPAVMSQQYWTTLNAVHSSRWTKPDLCRLKAWNARWSGKCCWLSRSSWNGKPDVWWAVDEYICTKRRLATWGHNHKDTRERRRQGHKQNGDWSKTGCHANGEVPIGGHPMGEMHMMLQSHNKWQGAVRNAYNLRPACGSK